MAINFPNSPANGDTHTAAGTTYVYDATNSVWKRQGSSGGFDPASVSESLIPDANETYDLGSSTNKFRDLYLSGNSITLGTVELSDNGGALEVTPTGGGSAEPFATETYVTTQVNNLVDAAPGALDTLNELAAALGDDAAFSTTVTNSLATKADTSSLATVATSGSYNDLSNQPTIPTNNNQLTNGAGYITAADVPNANTIEYTSTSSASVDDVVMLNTDGTVTPVEVTTFPEQLTNQGYNGSYQQLLPNNQGYTISNTNGLVAADKGYWLFPTQTDNKYISIAFDEAPGSVFEMKIVSVEYNSSNQTWTYGTEYQDLASLGNSLGLDKSDNPYVIGSPDNPDKFLILGPKLNADLIIHAVGTMAGSGITWSDTGTNTSNGGPTYANRLDHINWYYDHAGSTAGSYKIIGAYRDNSSNCRIFRVTWDGNATIQYSDDFAIPHPIDSRSLDFSKLTEGRFAGVDASGNLRIGDIDWGTGNITVGTAYGLTSFNTNFGTDAPAHVAWRDSSEHFVVAWSVGGGSNSLKLRAFSTTGNSAVAEGSEYSLGYNQGGTYGHLSGNMAFYKNSNMFALTNAGYYYLSNTSNSRDGSFITHFSVNSSLNIVIGTSRVTHGSNYYAKNSGFGYPGKIQMDPFRSGKGSISAAGNTDATSLVVKLFAQPTQGVYTESNLDASKIHGIAASAGTTIDVTVEGGIHTGLSGLTAGSKYYVLSDGSLSTTPDTNNAKVGLAMSSTTLAVDLLDELTSADLGTYATKSYVATQTFSGNYNDLSNKPTLATVATSGSYNDLTNLPSTSSYSDSDLETYLESNATADRIQLRTHNAYFGVGTANGSAGMAIKNNGGQPFFYGQKYLPAMGQTDLELEANSGGKINVNSFRIYNVATPTDTTDAATKAYVDSNIPNLSGYATQTYVDTEIANLVDTAPSTLDTLNELAAALGDDPNFATTITNQIAAKADAYSIATVTAVGGNFYIDGVQQVTLSFEPGRTYRFDQADSSNSSHPLRFSTTSDGTHGGGSEYTTGVTTNGTAGSAGAYVQIAITNATPTLYYYCVNHGGMGAGTVVGNFSGAYSDLTGAPSIPSAYTDSAVDTHLNTSSATTGQILSWNGTDYAWIDAAAGGGSSVSVSSTAPSSPSEGDLWFDEDDLVMYVWYTDGDSSQWIEANSVTAAAATIHASDTAPSGPSSGDLWFNTTLLDLYVYYADGDSNQWVQVGGAANSQTSGSGGGSSVQSLIETANTSVTTTDTGTDGHIDFTTNGTLRWEIDSNGHILPHSNASFDIGSAEKKVRYLFLDSNTMFVGDTSFSEDNIDRSMEVYTDQPAPSSSTDEGKKGDVRIVGNYMYICINTNEWIRTQIEKDW
jgi:hypothetical protein